MKIQLRNKKGEIKIVSILVLIVFVGIIFGLLNTFLTQISSEYDTGEKNISTKFENVSRATDFSQKQADAIRDIAKNESNVVSQGFRLVFGGANVIVTTVLSSEGFIYAIFYDLFVATGMGSLIWVAGALVTIITLIIGFRFMSSMWGRT